MSEAPDIEGGATRPRVQLDRHYQRHVLEGLAATYPSSGLAEDLGFSQDDSAWRATAVYLHEHGLIQLDDAASAVMGFPISEARITARGLDFLADDGGLGAILGVVTVKFETETLRALIESQIETSDLAEPEKSRLKELVGTAGGEALKESVKQLVGAAFKHGADAWNALQVLAI